MADWTYRPTHPYAPRYEEQPLIVNRLEDFSELRVEKGPLVAGRYTERYRASGAELQAMLAFFKVYRLAEAFTKKTYDPMDPTWDDQDPGQENGGPEERVRFVRAPRWSMTGVDDYSVTVDFQRLPNE